MKDAAKEAHHAASVERGGAKAAQHHAEIVAVGGLHGARGVAGRDHGFLDDGCEAFEVGRCARRGGRCSG